MRHLVLAFMILLLPLRGWTGDAMATSMATAELSALAVVAAPDHHAAVQRVAGALSQAHASAAAQAQTAQHHHAAQSAPFNAEPPAVLSASIGLSVGSIAAVAAAGHDCGGHDASKSPDLSGIAPDAGQAGNDGCGTCSSCQVCHTVALTQPAAVVVAAFLPAAETASVLGFFASADAARRQKPPIS